MNENGIGQGAERDEIEMLLPWYVTGKLDDDDRARVERYLADHPETAQQLELVREELDETVAVNETLGTMPAGALHKLLSRIEEIDGPAIARAQRPGLLETLGSWLSVFDTPALKLAAAAAAIVIVAQAVVIGSLVRDDGPVSYETASGPTDVAPAAGTRLLIAFADGANAAQITGLLEDIEGTIVSGPKAGGLFEVRISETKLTDAEVESVVSGLRQRAEIIRYVAISN